MWWDLSTERWAGGRQLVGWVEGIPFLWASKESIPERVHQSHLHQAFIEHLVNTDRKGGGGVSLKRVSNLMQWENASLKLGQRVSNPGSQCGIGGVDSILSSSKPWEADLFLLGGGLEWTVLLELRK